MVQNAEAVAKIHGVVGDRHGVERALVKADIASHVASRNGNRLSARVDTEEMTNARRNNRSPSPTSATSVEAFCACRQRVPWEYPEIAIEDLSELLRRHGALIEAAPFPAKVFGGRTIYVF